MKIKDVIKELSKYSEDAELRVFANCKNSSVGIKHILQYNTDIMLYLDSEDEKKLFNIKP